MGRRTDAFDFDQPIEIAENDLLAICRLGAVRLNAVAGSLEQRKATVKQSEFRRIISETFDDTHAAAAARRALPGLATAIRKFNRASLCALSDIDRY
jgi:hypothetical protein